MHPGRPQCVGLALPALLAVSRCTRMPCGRLVPLHQDEPWWHGHLLCRLEKALVSLVFVGSDGETRLLESHGVQWGFPTGFQLRVELHRP